MTRRLVVRVANCQGVSERQPGDEAHAAMTRRGPYGRPDVVLLSEVSWLDVDLLASRLGMWALQYGDQGSPEAGVAIATRVRGSLTAPAVQVGTSRVPGVRMRPLVSATIAGVRFTAGHAPPSRTPLARALYIARARACPGVVGGDWNRDPRWMRRTSTRRYLGAGVLGVLVPRDIPASGPRTLRIGSDHKAVDVRLEVFQ